MTSNACTTKVSNQKNLEAFLTEQDKQRKLGNQAISPSSPLLLCEFEIHTQIHDIERFPMGIEWCGKKFTYNNVIDMVDGVIDITGEFVQPMSGGSRLISTIKQIEYVTIFRFCWNYIIQLKELLCKK